MAKKKKGKKKAAKRIQYECKTISDWDELYNEYKTYYESGRQWIFRGQRNSEWKLRTSLERTIIKFCGDASSEQEKDLVYNNISTDRLGSKRWNVSDIEKRLFREFQRKSHHYISNPPASKNRLEWLTLMQHYGAPTRLLDFTYSFFVALYFAIEDAQQNCAMWAIDSDWLMNTNTAIAKAKHKQEYGKLLRTFKENEQEKFFRMFFWEQRKKGRIANVEVLNAYKLNDRLVIHQGVFLCSGDVNKTFSDNLDETVSKGAKPKENFHKLVIHVTASERRKILLHLHRMNINRTSLFPSLQGFGESLTKTFLALTDIMPAKFP